MHSPTRSKFAGIVFFWETSDQLAVLDQCRRRNPDILFASTGYRYLAKVLHQPAHWKTVSDRGHWIHFKNSTLFYLSYPLLLLTDIVQLSLFLLSLRLRSGGPIPTAVVNHLYHMPAFLLFRRLGLLKQLVFVSGDWLAGKQRTNRLWSALGSQVVFPWMDRLACSGSDRVLQITRISKRAREKYWGRKFIRSEDFFLPPLTRFFKNDSGSRIKNQILFLGRVRGDSGLELVLEVLGELHRKYGIRLKICGPKDDAVEAILHRSRELGLTQAIHFAGPFHRKDLPRIASGCFCGVNLSTDRENYSRYTLPAKSLDYLQYGVPLIANPYIGEIATWIRKGDLGQVVSLKKETLKEAFLNLHRHQKKYRQHIRAFLERYRGTDFGKLFPAAKV